MTDAVKEGQPQYGLALYYRLPDGTAVAQAWHLSKDEVHQLLQHLRPPDAEQILNADQIADATQATADAPTVYFPQ